MKKLLILIAVIVVSASIYIASAQTSSAPVDNNPATITAQVDEGATRPPEKAEAGLVPGDPKYA